MKTVHPAADAGRGLIRDISEADYPAVLDLNMESVHFLSPLPRERLERLLAQSAYHKVMEEDGRIAAFILAFLADAEYDSPNFLWLKNRCESFLYIDRLVVRSDCRGKGFGTSLYRDLFSHARAIQIPRIACEVDIQPPNPVSLRFHHGWGFQEIGSQWTPDGKKKVLFMEKKLNDADGAAPSATG
jgi:predicted GNAT superfamily acetyltransferase